MQPTIGRIVHYTLSATDTDAITAQLRRSPGGHISDGNQPEVGQTCAAVVVRVWDVGQPNASCNLQVLIDGTAQLWVTSRPEGSGPGTWSWPPRPTS